MNRIVEWFLFWLCIFILIALPYTSKDSQLENIKDILIVFSGLFGVPILFILLSFCPAFNPDEIIIVETDKDTP